MPDDTRTPRSVNVYLAGRITKNGWRHQFVPDLRSAYDDDDIYRGRRWTSLINGIAPSVNYVGPFMVGCDHGCGHDNRHAYGPACSNGHGGYAVNIAEQCATSIKRCDILIALIDSESHGALVEVGYALGLDKTVIVCYDLLCEAPGSPPSAELPEAWFAQAFANEIQSNYREQCCVTHALAVIVDCVAIINREYIEQGQCASPVELAFLRSMRRHSRLDGWVPNVTVMDGKYRIDFANTETMVGVEIDGHQYHSDKTTFVNDRVRQRELEMLGWKIVRYAGKEVHDDADACVANFIKWLDRI